MNLKLNYIYFFKISSKFIRNMEIKIKIINIFKKIKYPETTTYFPGVLSLHLSKTDRATFAFLSPYSSISLGYRPIS